MADVNLFGDPLSSLDKKEDYMKTKDMIKTLRSDLKDIRESLEAQIKLNKIMKKVKELREEIKGNETIRELSEKIQVGKERLDLLKELIRIDMLDKAQEELEVRDRVLKLTNVIRDIKNKKSKYHPDQLGFKDVEKSAKKEWDKQQSNMQQALNKFDRAYNNIVNDPDSGIDKVSLGIITQDGEAKEAVIAERKEGE